jgi:trehalose 2-sulfotransferase
MRDVSEPVEYLVCATPRSGAALLCDALAGTGAVPPPLAKLMWSDVDPLLAGHGELPDDRVATRVARLRELYPGARYVRVTRREKVRQAISVWRATHEGPPEFDFDGIDELVRRLFEQERAWQRFFADASMDPLVVVYEDFSVAYEDTVRRVLAYVGAADAEAVAVLPPATSPRSHAGTEDWLARYARELRGRRGRGGAAVAA